MIDLELEKKIEQAAEILEKSSQPKPQEPSMIDLIKAMGPERAKTAIRELSEDELTYLNDSLKKAVSLDKVASKQPKKIKQNASEEVDSTQESSRGEDEELVIPALNSHPHQGGSGDDGAWQGQVIKGQDMPPMLSESDEAGKKAKKKQPMSGESQETADEVGEPSAEGAKMQKGKADREEAKEKIMQLEEKEHGTKNPKKLVQAEKKEHMEKGKKGDMPAMMDEEDEAGKKAKKDNKPMSVEDGPKVEGDNKGLPLSVANSDKPLSNDKPLSGKPQTEAKPEPKAEGAKMQKGEPPKLDEKDGEKLMKDKKKMKKSEIGLDVLVARMKERKIEKSAGVTALVQKGGFETKEVEAAWEKKIQKGIKWNNFDPNHVLVASTRRGQNATYKTEGHIAKSFEEREAVENLAKSEGYRWREGQQEEVLAKTETEKPMDINDLIEKGFDRNQEQIKKSAECVILDDAKPDFAPKSFDEETIAWALGMDLKKAEEVIGGPIKSQKPSKK